MKKIKNNIDRKEMFFVLFLFIVFISVSPLIYHFTKYKITFGWITTRWSAKIEPNNISTFSFYELLFMFILIFCYLLYLVYRKE
jgi:hypothetical protein